MSDWRKGDVEFWYWPDTGPVSCRVEDGHIVAAETMAHLVSPDGERASWTADPDDALMQHAVELMRGVI